MADREKVIKGLEICKADLWSRETCKITGCPYADIPDGTTEYKSCRIKLMTDALSLLKAQEPRIMTVDQMKSVKDYIPIWLECLVKNETILDPAFLKFDGVVYHLLHETAVPNFDDRTYSKNWRCWTSRPTDEQREAVKWDD